MGKHICTICGYIYDPQAGAPKSEISAGTSFQDIPAEWVCPSCGVKKSLFEPHEK